jgi:rRNA-processing protein EBP2
LPTFSYKQALNATQLALPRLKALNVPTARPADYFAEMAKTDQQMDRVRKRLLGVQKRKETQANSRRLFSSFQKYFKIDCQNIIIF